MSGICGSWAIGASEGSGAPVKRMAALLETRGPDGTHVWDGGAVSLGHTLLATTPEALVETLPLTDEASGCVVTADARLDNREELIAALGLDDLGRTIGDGELILRAYLAWGEQCPEHLLGDFAFAIWDPREQRLFCARDHMGMRQLLYHHVPGRLFAFASDAEAVLAHGGIPKDINQARVADVIEQLEAVDLTSTLYESVARLPPAHALTVDAEGMAVRRYWRLTAPAKLRLDGADAYARAFLDQFAEAVRCRLRRSGRIGSMLSGGLDSGSVAAIAARLLATEGKGPLDCFSAVGPDPDDCPETRAIHAAASMPDLRSHRINHSQLGDTRGELEHLAATGDPFDSHMSLVRATYLAAHRAGIKVMLDGVGGDSVLNSGNRIAALHQRGRPLAALREANGEAAFWNPAFSTTRLLLAGAWVGLTPLWLRRWRRNTARPDRGDRLAPDFARAIGLNERRARLVAHLGIHSPLSPAYRLEAVGHPYLTAARERYDRVAASLGIEPRDPFMDIRLIQFCLSLPPEQVQSGGWPKLILRRAMAGILPEDIVWRRGKEHLGPEFTAAVWSEAGTPDDSVAESLRGAVVASAC